MHFPSLPWETKRTLRAALDKLSRQVAGVRIQHTQTRRRLQRACALLHQIRRDVELPSRLAYELELVLAESGGRPAESTVEMETLS